MKEFNFGQSVNASKRDRGSSQDARTNFSSQAFTAFRDGRKLISSIPGPLNNAQRSRLVAFRDRARDNWENAIAATVVHYINEVLKDMGAFGTSGYSFVSHAKHWSEMKGFALGLQFNPAGALTDAEFSRLHAWMGQAPALSTSATGAIASYRDALRRSRALLGDAYGFAPENLGDANGVGGW